MTTQDRTGPRSTLQKEHKGLDMTTQDCKGPPENCKGPPQRWLTLTLTSGVLFFEGRCYYFVQIQVLCGLSGGPLQSCAVFSSTTERDLTVNFSCDYMALLRQTTLTAQQKLCLQPWQMQQQESVQQT